MIVCISIGICVYISRDTQMDIDRYHAPRIIKTGMATLRSEKVDSKTRSLPRDKKGTLHNDESIQRKDIKISKCICT